MQCKVFRVRNFGYKKIHLSVERLQRRQTQEGNAWTARLWAWPCPSQYEWNTKKRNEKIHWLHDKIASLALPISAEVFIESIFRKLRIALSLRRRCCFSVVKAPCSIGYPTRVVDPGINIFIYFFTRFISGDGRARNWWSILWCLE